MSSIKLKYHKIVHTWARSRAGAIFQREHGPRRIQAPVLDKSAPRSHCSLLVGDSEMAVPSTSWLPGQQGRRPRPHPSLARPRALLSAGPRPRGHLGTLLRRGKSGRQTMPRTCAIRRAGSRRAAEGLVLSAPVLGWSPGDSPGGAWMCLLSDIRCAHPSGQGGRLGQRGSQGWPGHSGREAPRDAPPLCPESPLGPHGVCKSRISPSRRRPGAEGSSHLAKATPVPGDNSAFQAFLPKLSSQAPPSP